MKLRNKLSVIIIILAILATAFLNIAKAQSINNKATVYFFWGDGCPHCKAEKVFLEKIKPDYPELAFQYLEVYDNEENQLFFINLGRELTGQPFRGVPVIVAGTEYVVGFGDESTTGGQIKHLLNIYQAQNCLDDSHNHQIDGDGQRPTTADTQCETPTSTLEQIINYPLIGQINLKTLSLPLLTAVLGTLDGFNPCSMWALIMLITLLINTGSRKKMWIVGWTFIAVSSFSYFLFLLAWLNAFLLIGYLAITRIVIGCLAIGAGGYFLRSYWRDRKKDTITCEVSSSETKNKIVARIEKVLGYEKMTAIIIGVVFIAFSVNLIELLCSAGLPTVYTKILTMSGLPAYVYYLYILGYVFFYMLDDIVVLFIAGFTFRTFVGNPKYTKYSHLFGGILILILGLIMIFNPDLLATG